MYQSLVNGEKSSQFLILISLRITIFSFQVEVGVNGHCTVAIINYNLYIAL